MKRHVRTSGTADERPALLGRLRVGTKLMLLALLPVGVLVVVSVVAVVNRQRQAADLHNFRTATQESFAVAGVSDALSSERTATVLAKLSPGAAGSAAVAASQGRTDVMLRRAAERAASGHLGVDVAGRLAAIRRQVQVPRLQAATGSLGASAIAEAYGSIVHDLLKLVRELDSPAPTTGTGEAADAYLAILNSTEPAERERLDVAALLTPNGHGGSAATAGRWAPLETANLDNFRQNAGSRRTSELAAALFSPAGVRVTAVRSGLLAGPERTIRRVPLRTWLTASAARISDLQRITDGARSDLSTVVTHDLNAAQALRNRELGLLIAVLVLVASLALILRRSITRPLAEVSDSARSLSRGDLSARVTYVGRDEIGDVASAFRDLRVAVERHADEIGEMSGAVRDNQLDHRADVAAFEGAWSQLLLGLNDTMTAFSDLEGRRARAEREFGNFFELSLDLLGILNLDGYFTRVNPSFERVLGYPTQEMLSRPFVEFVLPEDRARSREAFDTVGGGQDVIEFENRYVCADGSLRWLQWSARTVAAEGLVYAAGRDVTERRRDEDEQSALRRIATLVAEGATPAATFSAVAAEVGRLVTADAAVVFRSGEEQVATVVGGWSVPSIEIPIGACLDVRGSGVAVQVLTTQRPARADRFEGPPGSIPAFFEGMAARSGVGAPITVEGRLWGVLAVVSTEPERFPAGSELHVAHFTDLLATAVANADAHAELTASRARIVATADETRRRIERDLHDGAQQRLLSLVLQLRMMQAALPADLDELAANLDRVAVGLKATIAELREFARGIHPAIRGEGGLQSALKMIARRSPVRVDLDVRTEGRLPEPLEVAAYYVVSEALTNVAKYANASVVDVKLAADDGVLRVSVRDDGVGGADFGGGSGLLGLKDRVEALSGRIHLQSEPGRGTSVSVELPVQAKEGHPLSTSQP